MARISSAGVLLLTGIACVGSLSAQNAQSCSGTQDFSGPYVFTAVRLAYVPQSTTPPATTTASPIFVPQATSAPGSTGQYSLTPIGQLVGYASNMSPFSSVGRVEADGAGVLYATRILDATWVKVGTYSVSVKCELTMTISDGFAANATSSNALPGVSFQGVLADRGNSASVTQNSLGSGVLLQFTRPFLNSGCGNQSLGGTYGLSGLGVDLTQQPGQPAVLNPASPLTFALQFNADGAGNIGNPLDTTGYTGTYVINTDCTGVLKLVSPDKSVTRNLGLVLTKSSVPGQLPRPTVEFVLGDQGKVAGFGDAR